MRRIIYAFSDMDRKNKLLKEPVKICNKVKGATIRNSGHKLFKGLRPRVGSKANCCCGEGFVSTGGRPTWAVTHPTTQCHPSYTGLVSCAPYTLYFQIHFIFCLL